MTKSRVEIPAGVLKPGTIGAMRMEIAALHKGRPVITRRTAWYVTKRVDPDWDLRDTGWRYQIDSDMPLDVNISVPVSPGDYPNVSPGMTAHPIVNAIPYVCAAVPGIVHTSELPVLVAFFGS